MPERAKPEDRALPVAQVVKCSRRLTPGEVRRTLTNGPLVGYHLACPSCGFIALQQDLHDEVGFEERDGHLVGMREAYRCVLCHRTVTIADGIISARHAAQ